MIGVIRRVRPAMPSTLEKSSMVGTEESTSQEAERFIALKPIPCAM